MGFGPKDFNWKSWRIWVPAALAAVVIFLISSPSTTAPVTDWVNDWRYDDSDFIGDPTYGLTHFTKPKDFPIVALVFFGRRRYVSILNCYLQRNLVSRGGLLDQVIFVVRTGNPEDLAYLEELLASTPEYARHDAGTGGDKYREAWEVAQNGTMYIKIDDDVLFFEDHAIAAVVQRKMANPEYLLVSANVVNQPAFGWVHYHLNTMHPYLPDLSPPAIDPPAESTWRASELPSWTGPDGYTIERTEPAPFHNHRWLPLDPATTDITNTPIALSSYTNRSAVRLSWPIAAQIHYSFLQNLEEGNLHRYKYDLWDFDFERLSINFMCVWGDDVVEHRKSIIDDDEKYLTVTGPKLSGRHAVMDGRALAVHFGFGPQVRALQEDGEYRALGDTDLVSRFAAYAQENVCNVSRRHKLSSGR